MFACLEVTLVEVVGDVPAHFSVLASLLHHCMEEGQHEDQGSERVVHTLGEGRRGDLEEGAPQVQHQPVRGLSHHLQAIMITLKVNINNN